VNVVQLVRTPDCDSGGRGFEPHLSPLRISLREKAFFMYYCYVLESESSGRLYIGQTNNVEDRLERHNSGINISTRKSRAMEVDFLERFCQPDRGCSA
jgi:hypothetical protein